MYKLLHLNIGNLDKHNKDTSNMTCLYDPLERGGI